jgi:hypothetical protein
MFLDVLIFLKEKRVSVEQMPAVTNAYLNDRTVFTCKYNGMPIPTIVWTKSNTTLIPNQRIAIQTFP